MNRFWTRRKFLSRAAGSTAALAVAQPGLSALAYGAAASPLRGRFITHVSLVRVNQIEVTPTRSIGADESADNSPAHIRVRREAFARGCPGGRMTWAISWLALRDDRQEYKDARRLLVSYHEKYGDEITFFPGGYFAPMYDTREHNRVTIHKALQMISEMVGNGYRPQCLVAGFMDAENQRYLATDEGIHVCQGQIWSQHDIDNGDGDGGICYPYYPSREHYLKPAQGPADFIDCVCLDGWTCDFLAARRNGFEGGFNSRMGVGPIETVGDLGETVGRKEMMDTTAMHFDQGHALNGFGWVTGIWEVSIGHDERPDLVAAGRQREMARHPGADRRSVRHGVAQAHAQQRIAQLPLRCQRDRSARLGEGAGDPLVHEPGVSARAAATTG